MEKRQSFQQVVLEQLDIHMQKVSSTDHVPFTKINSKWIIDLSVKCKIMRFPEDAIGGNLDDLWYGDSFLNMTPKVLSIKEVMGKLGFIKINIFCSVKDNVKRMIIQATN